MPRKRAMRTLEDEPWREFAMCKGQGAAFFDEARVREAKALCLGCPSRMACLVYGLKEADGVWGGLTPHERRVVKRLVRMGKSLEAAASRVTALARPA